MWQQKIFTERMLQPRGSERCKQEAIKRTEKNKQKQSEIDDECEGGGRSKTGFKG